MWMCPLFESSNGQKGHFRNFLTVVKCSQQDWPSVLLSDGTGYQCRPFPKPHKKKMKLCQTDERTKVSRWPVKTKQSQCQNRTFKCHRKIEHSRPRMRFLDDRWHGHHHKNTDFCEHWTVNRWQKCVPEWKGRIIKRWSEISPRQQQQADPDHRHNYSVTAQSQIKGSGLWKEPRDELKSDDRKVVAPNRWSPS
jgi:hypothetical protein